MTTARQPGETISLDPNDADAYIKRGETYANMKDSGSARMNYDQAISLDIDNPKLWYKQGCIQDDDLKIADLSKAIELDPAYVDAYNEHANVYFHRGNYFQDDDFLKKRMMPRQIATMIWQ
jgi:Tfp pilus assembly protein PilF